MPYTNTKLYQALNAREFHMLPELQCLLNFAFNLDPIGAPRADAFWYAPTENKEIHVTYTGSRNPEAFLAVDGNHYRLEHIRTYLQKMNELVEGSEAEAKILTEHLESKMHKLH